MMDRNDTTANGRSEINTYDCAPDTGERGPEIVYVFEVDTPGDFRAELVDPRGVDIDLHLLRDPVIEDGFARGCIARAHESLFVEDLQPGTYWLVADSWSSPGGTIFDGAFSLSFEVIPHNVWNQISLGEGIEWHRFRGQIGDTPQTINAIHLPQALTERLAVSDHDGCNTVEAHGLAIGAHLGINGGYFDGGCAPKGLVRQNGRLLNRSPATTPPLPEEAAVGWGPDGLLFRWQSSDNEWREATHALSAHPMLVMNGSGRAEVQPGEQVYSAIDWAANPRSAIGQMPDGRTVLVTIDGRTSAGTGLSTPALANWLETELGVTAALGLDGGGSTTLMIRDCWVNGVVNSPSDNGDADHRGTRPVSNGIYLLP